MYHQLRYFALVSVGFALGMPSTTSAANGIPVLPQPGFQYLVAQASQAAVQFRPRVPQRRPNQKQVSPFQVAVQALQAAQKEMDGKTTSTAALNAALADAKAAEDIVTELAKLQPKKAKDAVSDIDTALKNVKDAVKAIRTRKTDEAATSITAAIDALHAAEKGATGAKPDPKANTK